MPRTYFSRIRQFLNLHLRNFGLSACKGPHPHCGGLHSCGKPAKTQIQYVPSLRAVIFHPKPVPAIREFQQILVQLFG